MENNEVHYFAYGSNMNKQRMVDRAAFYTDRNLAQLLDHEFCLNKCRVNGTAAANIRPKIGECVYGTLYSCTPDTLAKLDVFEGVKNGHYERVNVKVLSCKKEIIAVTYIAKKARCDDNIKKVDKHYLDHILCGKDILPQDYVKFLESFTESFTEWTEF